VNDYRKLPQLLKEKGRFCCWRLEPSPKAKPGEKPRKVPYNPLTGKKVNSTKIGEFTDFETAVAAVGGYDGLGAGAFGDVGFIDIDGCVKDGVINAFAQKIIAHMKSPAEISPSGTGIRIYFLATGFNYDKARYYINNQSIGLEVYVGGATYKFVTLTGNIINEAEFGERGEELHMLLEEHMIRPMQQNGSEHKESCSYLTDEQVLLKASTAVNGESFRRLYEGDITGYPSQSDADLALLGKLAFWCGRDAKQMERIFSLSALGQRPKWTEREDYRNRTIEAAITGCKKTYTPDYGRSTAQEDFSGGSFRSHASLLKPAASVTSQKVPWLVEGFIIRGSITGFQGLPDSGKSYLTCALAVAVANGGYFPSANGSMVKLTPGRVLMANFDDSLEFGLKPRLESLGLTAEGAERLSFLDPIAAAGLTFDDSRLAEVFEQFKPDLAIFDTLQHFIGGKVDLHRANETNAAMVQLKLLAEEYNCAVIVVQHISKQSATGGGGASVLWGLGSTAINGLFRSLWTIGRVQGEDKTLRACVSSKNNLLPYIPPALQFSLSPEDGFQWRGVSEDITARDLIRGDAEKNTRGRPSERRSRAEEFILETLAFGEVKAATVLEMAARESFSERTLKAAKAKLGVRTFKKEGVWYWELSEGTKDAENQ
jgi:hypothetical protein